MNWSEFLHRLPGARTFRARRARRRTWRTARRLLRDFFADAARDPGRLEGTSLQPEHAARADLQDVEVADGALVALRFSILRHPRPFRFSRQFHEVAQLYRIDLASGTVEHLRSLNLSRLRGRHGGEPAG